MCNVVIMFISMLSLAFSLRFFWYYVVLRVSTTLLISLAGDLKLSSEDVHVLNPHLLRCSQNSTAYNRVGMLPPKNMCVTKLNMKLVEQKFQGRSALGWTQESSN